MMIRDEREILRQQRASAKQECLDIVNDTKLYFELDDSIHIPVPDIGPCLSPFATFETLMFVAFALEKKYSKSCKMDVLEFFIIHPKTSEEVLEKFFTWAAGEGHIDYMECLCSMGKDPYKISFQGYSPVSYAVQSGRIESICFFTLQALKKGELDKIADSIISKIGYRGVNMGIVSAYVQFIKERISDTAMSVTEECLTAEERKALAMLTPELANLVLSKINTPTEAQNNVGTYGAAKLKFYAATMQSGYSPTSREVVLDKPEEEKADNSEQSVCSIS